MTGAACLIIGALGACTSTAPSDRPGPCTTSPICVTGTVRYMTIEGGFYAIRGDDGVTYDPDSVLPARFQVDGLRVALGARADKDAVSFHMVGPIVNVLQLVALR